jgi:hypothetical protein
MEQYVALLVLRSLFSLHHVKIRNNNANNVAHISKWAYTWDI